MTVLVERLQTLRVGDAMADRLVEIPAHKTMAEAAGILASHQVSAAPVVDDHGRCVGLISGTDFVKCVAGHGAAPTGDTRQCPPDWQLQVKWPAEQPVGEHMTTAVQTVAADVPLVTAARMMCAQHYHRLLVLDEVGRPAGVLSTMDVVAAFVHLADEAWSESLHGSES